MVKNTNTSMPSTKQQKKTKSTKRQLVDKKESPAKKQKKNSACESREKYHSKLKEKLGVEMPDDFYLFHEFLQENAETSTAFAAVGLQLTGPYDILNGNIKEDTALSPCELHMHGRHYYDVPEVMSVVSASNSTSSSNRGFHIGYFRDDPNELPALLVSNKSEVSGEFSSCGENIFAAVYVRCQTLIKAKDTATVVKAARDLSERIKEECEANGYCLDALPPSVKKRQKNVNAKTFNRIGLVVPMDKSGVGYRELPNTDRELKQLFAKIASAKNEQQRNDELDEIVTLIQFANDECDYGMGLELGIDLFTFGDESLHSHMSHLLPLAYQLLKRDLYGQIVKAHMKDRKRVGFVSKC